MGLDMDFYKVDKNGEKEHLHYFRKHADLHGVLQDEYLRKNPEKSVEDFNCIDYELTMDDVANVTKFIEENSDKHYSGFFWGRSCEEDWEETITLFTKIYNLLKDGHKVIYVPWW
jgi:hypothetical protein